MQSMYLSDRRSNFFATRGFFFVVKQTTEMAKNSSYNLTR